MQRAGRFGAEIAVEESLDTGEQQMEMQGYPHEWSQLENRRVGLVTQREHNRRCKLGDWERDRDGRERVQTDAP